MNQVDVTQLRKELTELSGELQRLKAVEQIRKLQYTYGYCIDKCLYDEAIELFADDGFELRFLNGVFEGKQAARRLYVDFFQKAFTDGVPGPVEGFVLDHFMGQDVIDVSDDGQTAYGRFRVLMQGGLHKSRAERPDLKSVWEPGTQVWEAGVYENVFVRENGVWKFKTLNYQMMWQADYLEGWSLGHSHLQPFTETHPANPIGPDRLTGETMRAWPGTRFLPFHYPHPTTGEPWKHYPNT